jgi:hypothetical protein
MEERKRRFLVASSASQAHHPPARILRDNCGRVSSELLTASPSIPSCTQTLPASPPLAILEKRRGSLRRCLSLPGSKEAGKAARLAIGLRQGLAPLGMLGLESMLPRNPGNCASTWSGGARGRWADDGGCWSMYGLLCSSPGTLLVLSPAPITVARDRPEIQSGTVPNDDPMRGKTLMLRRHALICLR